MFFLKFFSQQDRTNLLREEIEPLWTQGVQLFLEGVRTSIPKGTYTYNHL